MYVAVFKKNRNISLEVNIGYDPIQHVDFVYYISDAKCTRGSQFN